MSKLGIGVVAALGVAGLVAAIRAWPCWPGSLQQLWRRAGRELERGGVRLGARYLESMGAAESARRAEQDALLARKVAYAVADRLGSAVDQLSVRIIGGVIHLAGRVGSSDERTEAERVAYQVSGANVIADDLRVESR